MKSKSVVSEYLDYYDDYVKKFGKDRTLVLMQVGSFYEAYSTLERGPDLKALENLTDATIAHKGQNKSIIDINNPLMWGFPMVASLKFTGILIENGYRLIMIDQVSPKPNIKREVVAIYSPGTYLESVYKPVSNFVVNIFIEELVQKNGGGVLCAGMSGIDVSTGEVYIHEAHSQINDDKFALDEINRFLGGLSPKEIIINKENLVRLNDNYLIEYLELDGKYYQFKEINKEHNKLIYQKNILEKIYPDRKNFTSIIDTLGLSNTNYARKSLVNLLIYISDHYESLVKNIDEPVFYLKESFMTLGNDAISQLNIIDNNHSDISGKVRFHNLMDVINVASTGMGKRYIKMRLVSPYTDPDILNIIYDTVDAFMYNKTYQELDLRRINDIERLYRKMMINLLQPTQLVDFINSFDAVIELFNIIKNNDRLSKFIKTSALRKKIREMNDIFSNKINKERARKYTINEIKENIFNEGIYPDLDKLQEQIGDNHEVMNELMNKLNDMIEKDSTNISVKHNKRDGYYYQLTTKRYKTLKSKFEKNLQIKLSNKTINVSDFEVSETKNNTKLTLPFLKDQTSDIDDLISQISNKSYKYYTKFLADIVKDYDEIIRNTINIITKIDYCCAIAKVSTEYNYTRPKIVNINNNGYISAKNIRHPIVERIIDHDYVPHDISIGQDIKGMLIYGLNSAGKSVLMKSIGISVIMAQAGFFVPSSDYTFYPYRALFTRITGNDNLFRGLSSYSLEIVELNSILKRSNESTLVIGDEVCRGTEHVSGNAIVAATLLKLSNLGSSFVFATHLHELMELDEIKEIKNIKAFHLSVEYDAEKDKLIYDRSLKAGSGERIYGITVAKYIIRDNEFIEKALEIKNKLINKDTNVKKSRYNSNLIIDKCHMCQNSDTRFLETHHIGHQKDCENGFVKDKPHVKKNQINNLIVLCQKCHDKIHNQNIKLDGIKMTSSGKELLIK